jgi:hypothetical protein
MATYATLTQLKAYLDQFADTTDHDTALTDVLERATAIVNGAAGLTTNATTAASGTQVVYGSGTLTLDLPPHSGAVTLVSAPSGYTVPDYVEVDGSLVVTDTTGIVLVPYRPGLAYTWGSTLVWQYGLPYTVTAPWGYAADTMAILEEATLQVAVQL